MEKAFDKVWCQDLVNNMFCSMQTRYDFSTADRSIYELRIRFETVLSEKKISGECVPRGLVPLPLLYNSDIITHLANVAVLPYASDTTFVSYSKNQIICATRLQRAAYTILEYLARWRILVNSGQWQHINFTYKCPHFNLFLNFWPRF